MNWKKTFVSGFFWSAGMIFSILIVFFVFKFFIGLDRLSTIKGFFFVDTPIDNETMMNLEKFGILDKIIPFNTIFIQTLDYYDTIIQILVGLLAVVVAGAFFYIRYSSEEKSREYAEKYIDNYLATKEFHDKIEGAIKDQTNEWGEDMTKGFERIEKIEGRVTSLEEDRKKSNESLEEAKR